LEEGGELPDAEDAKVTQRTQKEDKKILKIETKDKHFATLSFEFIFLLGLPFASFA
jgi:hypothetical protein